ncbi:Aste57867_24238 [Aphanomyces stellatus]|uniref:Aste57867_24238 protein n=1 Tax=Aphanomyces stellatus TaxID=120398 RepID=A0A485LPT5_9STRA|nr:hypothetical protein As57867_024163 [Aphanomyces stellatus]VFU00879.1 Aste57867_24238 [Aphanomyces stellatus]
MLVTRYEARTYANVSHAIHELHTKAYSPGSSMQKYVTDMRGHQQKLLIMCSRVEDNMLGRILLTSVKEAVSTTVEILSSREPSLTLTQITNRLLAKEDEVKSNTTTKRKADDEQLLYMGKPDKPRPFTKQVVKDKCPYCHKIGHHAFECRFKKRDLAKGITRKRMPTDEDQINILQHDDDDDEGFILATLGDVPLSDIENAWILDSACSADVTGNKALFTKLARTQPSTMQLADNSTVQSMHVGLLSIQVDKGHSLDRPNAKFDGFEIAKWDLDVVILIRDTRVLRFTHHRGLYVLRQFADQINSCLVRQATPKSVQGHMRLAHLNFGAIKQAARDGVMEGLHLTKSDLAQDYSCEVCEVAKARRMSYKNTKPYRAHVPLERVHIDKGGPFTPPTFGGKRHYELYVDEGSQYKWLLLTPRRKLPPLVIVHGKPGGPVEQTELPTYPRGAVYAVQENAWMDERVWDIYLRELLTYEIEAPTIVVVDNLSAHVTLAACKFVQKDLFSQVEELPANATSMCQPLDVGVMGPFKAKCRTEWLHETMVTTAAEKRLAMVQRILKVWDGIPSMMIKRSFDKAIPQGES